MHHFVFYIVLTGLLQYWIMNRIQNGRLQAGEMRDLMEIIEMTNFPQQYIITLIRKPVEGKHFFKKGALEGKDVYVYRLQVVFCNERFSTSLQEKLRDVRRDREQSIGYRVSEAINFRQYIVLDDTIIAFNRLVVPKRGGTHAAQFLFCRMPFQNG